MANVNSLLDERLAVALAIVASRLRPLEGLRRLKQFCNEIQ